MTETPRTLIQMLQTTAAAIGDDRGITFYTTPTEVEFLGYGELDRRSRAIAQSLQARGVQVGDGVVLAVSTSLEFIEAAFGSWYAGAVLSAAAITGYGTSGISAARIAGIVEGAGASFIISQAAVLDGLEEIGERGALPDLPIATVAELRDGGDADAWVEPPIDPSSRAALQFTSGSTGAPKGAILTHGSLLGSVAAGREVMTLERDSVFVGWFPFHHIAGLLGQIIIPAAYGCNAVLTTTTAFQKRPIFWLQLVSKHRATHTVAANFAFDVLAQLATDEQVAELDLSSLVSLLSGSEPVRAASVHRFVERFKSVGVTEDLIAPAMGMTEAPNVSGKRVGQPIRFMQADAGQLEKGTLTLATGDGRSVEMVSCGPPSSFGSLRIVDPDTLTVLPEGQVGEIWVAGPFVAAGYWRNPEATAETFGQKLPGDDHDYVRTGDLAALIDGELYVAGRLKDLIIIRGRNIYPQDLEAAATRVHDAVGLGAAFELVGHPSDVGIVLELDPELAADPTLVSRDVRKALIREFSLPSVAVGFIPPGTIPRTASGKVRRSVSRGMLENGELELVYADGFVSSV